MACRLQAKFVSKGAATSFVFCNDPNWPVQRQTPFLKSFAMIDALSPFWYGPNRVIGLDTYHDTALFLNVFIRGSWKVWPLFEPL